MTVPRLSAEQRRALRNLADAGINGVTETTMLAHGFWRGVFAWSFLQAPPRTMAPSPRSLFISRFSVNKTNGRTRFRLCLWPTGRIDFHHEIRQEQRRLRAD
jgi:hypothetical protein